MQRYFNNVTRRAGNGLQPVQGALVTVSKAGGGLATLYSDNSMTPTANPVATDADGEFSFYAGNGVYTLTVTHPTIATQTVAGVQLFDSLAGESTPDTAASYTVGDVALGSSQFLDGRETIFNAAAGAANIFRLGGYKPVVAAVYVGDGTAASSALFQFISGRYARLLNASVVNGGVGGVLLVDTDGTGVNRPTIDAFDIEDFTGVGLDMRSSVTELRASNVLLQGKVDYVGGLGKPRAGSIGWKQSTPVVGGLAVGGHQVSSLNCITCDTGIKLTDAQLSTFCNVFADSCSGYGVDIDGACVGIDFHGLFVGTTRGLRVAGSSVVAINGLRTMFNGTVPPWGQVGFFNGTAYDIVVEGTAQLTVNGWRGDKKVSVASTAKLVVLDGVTFKGRSLGTVGAGSTGFIAEWGSTAGEIDAIWRAPAAGRLMRMCPTVNAAPGAGQSFTYTARLNGADTALTAAIAGAGVFGGADVWHAGGGIAVAKGDSVAIKLQTSAGAAAANHFCELQFIPD